VTTAALLSLVQWLSPAFPTGGFAYSHGLEWAIATGRITSAEALEGWIAGILRHGAGRQDGLLLALALRPGADHAALDATARALAPSAERLAETLEQGAAFARTVAALSRRDLAPRALPVALGQAALPLGLPVAQVVALYLHAFAGALVSVGVRFVPLGQTEGQRVLAALHPLIEATAGWAAEAGPDDLGGAALVADLAALAHETMSPRIYRT
jgi:urease accessory protein